MAPSYESNRWQGRASALLNAVADVSPPGHPLPVEKSAASAQYRKLFDLYVRRLRTAKDEAESWWGDIIKTDTKKMRGDKSQAERTAREMRPLGPLSHPEVIGTLRRFWLDCVDLNAQMISEKRVPPEQFLLKWLIDAEHEPLARFLSEYTFWPIGLDSEGNWL